MTLVATAPTRSSQGQGSVKRGHRSQSTSLIPVTSQGTYNYTACGYVCAGVWVRLFTYACLLQLKSLHPFAFGDSASDHSKMQGFVRQLQEVETHSTEYVKSDTYIPSHTHMHWVRYIVTCLRCDHPSTS